MGTCVEIGRKSYGVFCYKKMGFSGYALKLKKNVINSRRNRASLLGLGEYVTYS